MANFTLTVGLDNFTGNPGEHNTFQFTASTLQSTDTVTGGATGSFIDILSLTSPGTVTAAQFAGVTNVEQLNLPNGTNSVTLTNGLVAGTSLAGGFFVVLGGSGGDTIDGSSINNGIRLSIAAAGGADTLKGGTAADVLDGGTGADTMTGGLGDDVYYVDNVGDVVTEGLNQGNDVVYSSISYVLPANVESVALIEGAGPLFAVGNSAGNALIGNSENNVLDGMGGDDHMVGGVGDDIYFVDSTSDEVIENANEGNDIVYASIDYTIGANIE